MTLRMPEELDPTGRFIIYFGNHYLFLPPPETRRSGSISFRHHLGRRLSDTLWEDITELLGASKLLVYRHNEGMWTINWGPYTCIVLLNEDGTVHDICWNPGFSLNRSGGVRAEGVPPVSGTDILECLDQ